jgi:hypothetical protein
MHSTRASFLAVLTCSTTSSQTSAPRSPPIREDADIETQL